MRRVLAFVLLFGAGLLVLKLFDRDGAPNVEPRPLSREGDFEAGTRLLPRGAFFHARFDELPGGERVRRYDVESLDSHATEGGGIVLETVGMDFYDDAGERLLSTLEAARALGRVVLGGAEGEPRLASRLELENATLTVMSGNALVPLVLTAPTLAGDLATGVFETPDRAEVKGTGLAASGTGLDVDMGRGHVEFREDSSLSITTDRGVVATLTATGPLTFDRDDAAPGKPLRVSAHRQARLAIEDQRGTVLEADRIDVLGRTEGDGAAEDGTAESGATPPEGATPERAAPQDEELRFDALVAVGNVLLRSEGRVFRAERASFTLDAQGQPTGAVLEGNPRAELPTDPDDTSPESRAHIWGRGPMTLAWPHAGAAAAATDGAQGDLPRVLERTFDVAGPARLTWNGAELWATGGILSTLTDEDGPVAFRAWGDVEVRRSGWTLRTPEVSGTAHEEVLDFTARGPGTIHGERDDGAKLDLLARDGFRFRWEQGAWNVPWAKGVVLEWDGERSLSARAERLEDLAADLERDHLAFTAVGGVEVSSGNHFLRGARLVARSMTDGDLFGDAGAEGRAPEPATYVSPFGEVSAAAIHREGDRLWAEGGVQAAFDVRGLADGTLRADRIDVSGLPEGPEEADGTPVVLIAEGDVGARVTHAGAQHDLTAAWLRFERSPGPTEASTAGHSALLARGRVESRVERDGIVYEISSDEVVAQGDDLGLDADDRVIGATGTAVASGNVQLVRLGAEPLAAHGERLSFDHEGNGRLEALPGQRVRAFGSLPGGDRPFELDAIALEFRGTDELVALHPRIDVADLTPSGDLERATEAFEPKLEASAERLVATRDRIVFTGDCRVDGATSSGAPWTLLSDRATLVAAVTDGEQPSFGTLTAEGLVVARFADGRRAEGDRLTAEGWSRRVRLEALPGNTVRLVDRNTVWEATPFIELDTLNLLPETGSGTMRPRRADDVDPRVEPW